MEVRALFSDIHTWFGIMTGIAGTAMSVLALGHEVVQAPEKAEKAKAVAYEALSLAEQNEMDLMDLTRNLRIVFCTKEDWLSAQGRVSLECWRVQPNTTPRRF